MYITKFIAKYFFIYRSIIILATIKPHIDERLEDL
jgi:hypothetical protein